MPESVSRIGRIACSHLDKQTTMLLAAVVHEKREEP